MSPTEPTELQATGHRTAEFVEYSPTSIKRPPSGL